MKHALFFCIPALILFCNSTLHSQWTRTGGPGGGFVSDMASNTSYLYAGSTNGVFRSADEGLHWERMENGLPFSFFCYQIKAQDENLMLFGSDYMEGYNVDYNYDLYKSADNGDSWSEIKLPDTVRFLDQITFLDDMIFVADKSLLRSTDNGQTWEYVLTETDTFYNSASALEIFDEKLYVVGRGKKMWVTSDWGVTWEIVRYPAAINAYNVYAKDSLLIVIGDAETYHSIDYGQTWVKAKGWERANSHWNDIINLNDTIYASSSNLLRSIDWGLNWEAVPPSSISYHVNGVTTDNKHVFAFSYSEGLKKFNSLSESYQSLNLGIDATLVSCLSVHDDELWAGVDYNGLYKYDIESESWDTTNYFPVPFQFSDIAWVGDSLFAIHSFGDVYRSGDGGFTWIDITHGKFNNFSKFLVEGNTIFLFGEGDHLAFKSSDYGDTWVSPFPSFYTQTHEGVNGFSILGSQYFISTNDHVFRSSDGGLTWENKSAGIETGDGYIRNIYTAGNALFAEVYIFDMISFTFQLSLFGSRDQGENWEITMLGLPAISNGSPNDERQMVFAGFQDTIVLGTRSDGIFFSTITDPEWHPWMVQDQFPSSISSFVLKGSQLYAGTLGMGVWQRGVTNPGTGLKPLQDKLNPLFLFPNPVNTKLTIAPVSKYAEDGSVFIYTSDSRLFFYTKMIVDQQMTVDVSEFPEGEYVVQVEVKGRVHTGKFIKHRD
ncbi:MAG TPA: T9SS type A sorting domain-containing protein [Saprospiraceae bacterium]|nr:T9SS type A sorting domain-containing protein [Saprospiraceae bacterium]